MATTDSAERTGRISRARILEIAVDHFGTYGFKGGSMAQIAAAAGMSQPGLLHHFSNKTALFLAALAERDRSAAEYLDIDASVIAEMTFDQLLEFYERIVANNIARHRGAVQFAHMASAEASAPDHPAREWVVGHMELGRRLCTAALERSIAEGTVRADVSVEHTANLLIAISEGLENQWLVDDSIDVVGSFRTFVEQLRAQLTPDQKS